MSFLGDGAVARLHAFAAGDGEGEIVGDRFELTAPIGEGGMGVVWSAWDREAEREVAVKVLRDADEAARERFSREVAALSDLGEAAVAKPIAHGLTASGAPFLAMERLEGRTLAERLAAGRLGLRETVALGRAAARALSAVHAAGLVHRDVKPSNLFLVRGDPADVRLLDFGLARGRDGIRITRTGALVGTPGYMAPEQVRGEAEIGPLADVFALGATLFECLAGRPAFFAEDAERVLAKILLEEPPLLRSLRPAVPLALEGLVESMLAKDPAMRPAAALVSRELASIEGTIADTDETSRPAVGSLVGGKYRVEGTIGEGGMGVILAATHVELGKKVALKLLRTRRGGEDEARLYREARALSRLESEHAARVLDVGRLEDGAPYVVIERLEGADLARVLRDRGRLPISEAVRYVVEAGKAISEAHALGIVHRDIKPSNLFLTMRRDGSSCIKVLDFGISKVEGDKGADRTLTAPSTMLGSPWYMSPEQLTGEKRVDARTDVWALGVVLHELLAGSPPFDAETAAGVGARIAAGEPAKLRAARPEVPLEIERAILRCLEKDPAARFQTVDALSSALSAASEGDGAKPAMAPRVDGSAPVMAAPTATPGRGRLMVPAAIAALAALAAIGMLLSRPSPRPPSTSEVMAPSSAALPPAAPSASASVAVVAASPPVPPEPTATATASVTAEPKPVRAAKAAAPAAALPAKTADPKPKAPPKTVDVRDPALDGR